MLKRLVPLLLFFMFAWGDCNEDEVELWDECYSIENTTELDLSNSGLDGSIPPELGNLINLTKLKLYNNQLTGEIPPEIGNLTDLTYLYLYTNELSGSIPPEIGNLTALIYLYLSNNQFSGSIPPEIGNLTDLTYLYLYNNEITGEIPTEISNLTNLTYLKLYNNQFTGVISESICNLNLYWSDPYYFNVSNNQLCPPYPACIDEYVGEQNCDQISIKQKTHPITYSLSNAYPNPFNPMTTIHYDLPEDAHVNITIYDMVGRIVKTLINYKQTAGYRSTQWNATNDAGSTVSAGIYLYIIHTGHFMETKKMVLLK